MNLKLIRRIEELFKEALSAKTGWGRNEILIAYKDCVITATLEMAEFGEDV